MWPPPSLEAQLCGWGFGGRLVRLSRGVACDLFHPGPERPAAERPVLLHVGWVAPEKNIKGFLARPEAATGPVRKVVAGDGPQLAALRQRHPEVTFRGLLTGVPLAEVYRAADVFVFPSRTDTFGLVLIQAPASGLPVAAHDVPGPRDIVTAPGLAALDADLGRAIARPATPMSGAIQLGRGGRPLPAALRGAARMKASPVPARPRLRALFVSDLHPGYRGADIGALNGLLAACQVEQPYLVGDILDGCPRSAERRSKRRSAGRKPSAAWPRPCIAASSASDRSSS